MITRDPPVSALMRWWGIIPFLADEQARWTLGPFDLWVHRGPGEWRVAIQRGSDPLSRALSVSRGEAVGPWPQEERFPRVATRPEEARLARYATRSEETELLFTPCLADRPMVVRPELTTMLLGDDRIKLFVSTPLWLRIDLAGAKRLVLETSLFRPSDTWFGPSTRVGELCYASRTKAKTARGDLQIRASRAITPVEIRNRGADPLRIERIKLPTPHLALYADRDGVLWTNEVIVERQGAGSLSRASIGRGAPSDAPDAELVSAPRVDSGGAVLLRALSGFVS